MHQVGLHSSNRSVLVFYGSQALERASPIYVPTPISLLVKIFLSPDALFLSTRKRILAFFWQGSCSASGHHKRALRGAKVEQTFEYCCIKSWDYLELRKKSY